MSAVSDFTCYAYRVLFPLISDLQSEGILKNFQMADAGPINISICMKDNIMSVCKTMEVFYEWRAPLRRLGV